VTVPTDEEMVGRIPADQLARTIEKLRREMREAAKELEFERAADLRDRIRVLEGQRLRLG
jgi:excinuclease ABC subunit B